MNYLKNYLNLVREPINRKWEAFFESQLAHSDLPPPIPQYRFRPDRRWRLDYAWASFKVGCEVEGGLWRSGGGAHSHPANIIRDIEKGNALVMLGWRVLRFGEMELKNGTAIEMLKTILK